MKKLIAMITCALVLTLCLTACDRSSTPTNAGQALARGGVLVLSVNPEIAVSYDENGNVTGITARNEDALEILSSCTGLIGQPTREVVTDLVTAIGEAGYFVEEAEGEYRRIVLEIEPGSSLPSAMFLEDVISDIREVVGRHDWAAPLVLEGETDYGISDYRDTDYGPENDGVTDYGDTDYGPDNDGATDFGDTDYGPDNDGVTDFGDTDYGTGSDGVTDYGDTDYGTGNDGVTDYTDYGTTGSSNYGSSVYGDSLYGNSGYGDSGYEAPANYGSSDSGYSSYDADSGYSDYHGES